ncbi:hypothetical protein CVT26_004624 [Gymnopilus dilepis]|uniref:Retrotransposon gag domain-containing protein n=1 Tax=Gymnopilus dilepis TaxID=231916 RepID=A0A409YTN0_9AGAR|nr:hypothetical protein CVT26_004624 [Gymnopilus dilepis]
MYVNFALITASRSLYPPVSSCSPPDDSDSSDSTSSSDSDSDPSSSSSDSSISSSDDESETSDSSKKSRTHRRSKKHRKSKKKPKRTKRGRSPDYRVFKPLVYSGQTVLQDYHRFVREGTAYIKQSGIRQRDQVFVLSHFLKDTAYRFYTQKVAIDEEKWTLDRFFSELFNYCFPIDYRMQMRKKLEKANQHDKTVTTYVYELEEMFNMLGSIPEMDRVIKLWYSLRPSIQRALWRDGYNPEVSSWNDVIRQAEIIEISEGVADGPARKLYGSTSTGVTFSNRENGSSRRHRNYPQEITDTATVLGADRVNHAYIPIDRIIQSLNSIDIGHHLTEFQSNQSLALLLGFRTRKRPKDLRQALVSLAEKRDIYLATVRVDMLLNQAVQNHLVSLISMLNLWGVAQTSLSKFWIVYHSE